MLAAVWRSFRFSAARQPIVMRSPGGGFHVWIPLTRGGGATNGEHTWPRDWARAYVIAQLRQAGIEPHDGDIEVFPQGRRLRAPCGAGMELLDPTRPDCPDDLGLVRWRGTYRWRVGKDGVDVYERQVVPMVRTFVELFESRRFTLEGLTGRPEAAWDRCWAFFGRRPAEKNQGAVSEGTNGLIQQIAEVPGLRGAGPKITTVVRERSARARRGAARVGPGLNLNPDAPPDPDPDLPPEPAGTLAKGLKYMRKVTHLLTYGLTKPGVRHDAVMVLTFFYGATCGLERAATLQAIERWCAARSHAGSGTMLKEGPAGFASECLREAANYYDGFSKGWYRGKGGVPCAPLSEADDAILALVDRLVRAEAATILSWLAGNADESGWVGAPVEVCHRLLRTLCGERRVRVEGRALRATVMATDELVRLGVLTLHTNYAVGRHGRVFQCWYRFGSGRMAKPHEITPGAELVVPEVSPHARDRKLGAIVAEARQDALGDAIARDLVVAERVVPEGVLRVLSDGTRAAPRVVLERPRIAPAIGAVDERGVAWWASLFLERRFSVDEFRTADSTAARRRRRVWPVYTWMREAAPRSTGSEIPRLAEEGAALVLVTPPDVLEAMEATLRRCLESPRRASEVGGQAPAMALAA